jgi:8-oxo-dGTP pyrophosphatase MutT (NUDIX family)
MKRHENTTNSSILKRGYRKLSTIKPYHGAGILFWHRAEDGQVSVLLGLRKYNPQKGMWSIPGGKWEAQDSYDDTMKPNYKAAAVRETWEEIRVRVENPEMLTLLWSMHVPFYHFAVYACWLPEKRAIAPYQELLELKWFSVDSLPKDSVGFVRLEVAALKRATQKGDM